MEETLYDIDANPVAYINYDKNGVIYMWNGTPVAYLHKNMTVYGFNGYHLGWYENGIMRNTNGYIEGYNRLTCPRLVKMGSLKGIPKILPIKSIREIPSVKPLPKSTPASEYLSQFLLRGL